MYLNCGMDMKWKLETSSQLDKELKQQQAANL